MKILFLSHSFYPQLGGIEANSELLAGAFTRAGHAVHLVTWTKESGEKTFPYQVVRHPGVKKLVAEHKWAELIFENNPCFRLGWPALLFGKPSVIAINTWITRADGQVSLRDKIKVQWWLKRSKQVIAVSDAVRKVCWPAATVILNPYNTDNFFLEPSIKRNATFAFLGRLVSDKGAGQAIEALHQLRKSLRKNGPKVALPTLTIIGGGEERTKLEELTAELSLVEAVIFTGPMHGEKLRACLNSHQYLLVPSAWEEPFGNVVLEGMACGCLPIASDGGGLPEAVGDAGLTFRRNNIENLVESMGALLRDPVLERRLRLAIPAHLAAHQPAVVAARYLQVLEKAYRSK